MHMNQVTGNSTDQASLLENEIQWSARFNEMSTRVEFMALFFTNLQTWIQDLLIQDQDQDSAVSRPRLRPRL